VCCHALTLQTIVRVLLDTATVNKSESLMVPIVHLLTFATTRSQLPVVAIIRLIMVCVTHFTSLGLFFI
jgi:hypothetical protein